jgi:hypothetical protein
LDPETPSLKGQSMFETLVKPSDILKVKINVSLSLTKHSAMKAYRGVDV